MKKISSALIRFIAKITGRNNFEKALVYAAKTINADLHLHGLIQIGAVSSFDSEINGEEFFLQNILPGLLTERAKPVLFDVGANVGLYSTDLRKCFPAADIYSFEPVKNTFDILAVNVNGLRIKLYNLGFSNAPGTGKLFNTVKGDNNTIASAYKDVFQEVFDQKDELATIEFEMDTIDNFCRQEKIKEIDFLKMDVEGHELTVLQGSTKMLSDKCVKIVQFEFNSHNVYSRVFLRDFYLLLDGFELYRVVKDGLIALGAYKQVNEIFMLQNIVAVRKDLCHLIKAEAIK